MRIFVNNVDGYLAGAICADLTKISKNLVGTRKLIRDELVPPMVKRIVPRVDVRRFLKAVTSCNVIVYDMHDADFEELELVVRMLQMSEISHDVTFILISSIGVWSRTARSYEELPVPEAPAAPEPAADEPPAVPPPAAAQEGDADDAEGGGADVLEEQEPPAAPPLRPVALKSQDYTKRLPAPKFQEWKDLETQVLALKDKPGGSIRPYVVCAGVPYGNGEDAFLGLFKSAWQSRPTLRIIGEGKNYIPMVHARDVARLTRHLLEVAPAMDYHVAVDRGDVTQKALIQAVAQQFNLPYDPAPVTVAEAILAELADILTVNLRFDPSDLMEVPWEAPPEVPPEEEEHKEVTEGSKDEVKAPEAREASRDPSSLLPPEAKKGRPNSATSSAPPNTAGTATAPGTAPGTAPAEVEVISEEGPVEVPPPGFRWWCETGIVENMPKVASEFCLWRRLVPVKLSIVGPRGNGSSNLCQKLAEIYNVPALVMDELIQDFAGRESPLGLQIKEQRDLIAANAANPKSQGPFTMSGQLAAKVLEAAIAEKPGTHRGWVISGFPNTLEEALAFYSEAPATPAEPPKKGKEAEALNLDDIKFKDDWKPDLMVIVNSAREVCQARAEGDGDLIEKEFQTSLDQWTKDSEQIQEVFTKHLGAIEVKISADQAAEAEREKHEAAVKAAEEEEREAPAAPDEKDLVVLASSSWSWVESSTASIATALEELHPIFNFLPPSGDALASQQASKAESGDGGYVVEGKEKNDHPNEEKLRQEARVEQVKKEELARLEKHSEPLRLYLMKFVVPALTGALVELCHEQPEDPVGYLAEYLSLYSEVAREREKESLASR